MSGTYLQNAECPDNTLHCNLEQHLVHNTCSSAAALTGQVLLQVTVHCNLRTTSVEKTYREDTEYRSATFVLVPSNSVVIEEDHFSFVKAQWWLVVTRNQSYRVEPRGWGIYGFGIAVPILYVCI